MGEVALADARAIVYATLARLPNVLSVYNKRLAASLAIEITAPNGERTIGHAIADDILDGIRKDWPKVAGIK